MPASFVIHVGIKGSSFVELFVLSYRVGCSCSAAFVSEKEDSLAIIYEFVIGIQSSLIE